MPQEVTRFNEDEARKNRQRHSPYPIQSSAVEPSPPPNSPPQPRKLEECIKIRTGQLLRHRELCGNTIISQGRSKRSFRAEYRKCHAMKPTIWNYSRSKTKASVSLEHAVARVQQAHGLVDRDILLTGSGNNIIQMFLEGEDEHGTAPFNYEADCILPQNMPRNNELAQRLGSSAGAIFWSTSDVSCVMLLTSAREVADSVSNHLVESNAPVILAKACEMLIRELTLRSWDHTEEKKRRTLQRGDVAIAVENTDVFDFLVDIVPRERSIEEVVGIRQRGGGGGGGFGQCPCEGASYSYMPPPPAPPTFVGNPAGQSFTSQPMWPTRPLPPLCVVNARDAAQSYVAQPMWPRPPIPPPPSSVVNVGDAAQSHVWLQPPPPPVPAFVEDPAANVPHAAQSYIAPPVWPSAGLSDVAAM